MKRCGSTGRLGVSEGTKRKHQERDRVSIQRKDKKRNSEYGGSGRLWKLSMTGSPRKDGSRAPGLPMMERGESDKTDWLLEQHDSERRAPYPGYHPSIEAGKAGIVI